MRKRERRPWWSIALMAALLAAALVAVMVQAGWWPRGRGRGRAGAEGTEGWRDEGTKEARLPASPGYRVLIAAAPRCEARLAELKHVVPSARKLHERFVRLGYDATLLSESDATATSVTRWLHDNAGPHPPRPELMVLVLIGHGGLRNGQQYFLTREATETEGGLRLSELDALAARHAWPLVVVVDACRSELGPSVSGSGPVQATADHARANLAGRGKVNTRNVVLRPDAHLMPPAEQEAQLAGSPTCTKLFATRYGREAVDAPSDLVSALAEALEVDSRTGRFRADPWWHNPAQAAASNSTNPLSLLSWFMYGMNRMYKEHQMVWHPVADVGTVDLLRPLAQANPPGPPTGEVRRQSSDIDLMAEWRPEHGHYRYEQREDGSWRISSSRERATNEPEPWTGGFVHQKGTGFPTSGRALWMEIVAIPDHLAAEPPDEISLKLDAKHIDAGNGCRFVSEGGGPTFCVVPVHRPTWCRVGLRADEPLNYLAVVDIEPPGTLVIVRAALLCDANRPLPVAPVTQIDLLPRWWLCGDSNAPDSPAIGSDAVDGQRVIRIGPSRLGWAGGVVGPVPWAGEHDVVRLILENPQEKTINLGLHLKDFDRQLANRLLRLPPGKSAHAVKIDASGPLNYIAIHRPGGDVRVWSMRLEPGRPPTIAK